MRHLKLWLRTILIASGSSSSADAKQDCETCNERNPTEKKAEGTSPILRPVVDIPEPIFQEYRAYQEGQQRENKANRRIATAAVIGAWFYALIALAQLYSSERAYVGVLSAQMRTYAVGKPVEVSSTFDNVGRTTATHVVARNGVYFAARGARVDWNRVAAPPSWSDIYQSTLPILPNSPYHFPTATKESLTADLEKQIVDGTEVIVVLTAADYLDQFLIVHRVRSCETYFPKTSEFLFCKDNRKAD